MARALVVVGEHPLRGAHGERPGRDLCPLVILARRAERLVVALARAEKVSAQVVPYLNRLSDALFVLARLANKRAGRDDVLWRKRVPLVDRDRPAS